MDQMFQPPHASSEQLPAQNGPGEALPQIAPAEQLSNPEKSEHVHVSSAGAAVQQAYADDAATAVAPQATVPNDAVLPTVPVAQTSTSAADIDVIEKVWVEKAKSIVAKTKDDPREQSAELTGIKREYIEKRFGKSLPDNRAA